MLDSETIIIGGGPAGSSCAWELRKRNRECLILERQDLPKTKSCAGWITPKVLQDLEIEPVTYPHGLLELSSIRIVYGASRASAIFATSQFSIRREQFDTWLLERSKAKVYRHAARKIVLIDGYYVIDEKYRCKYLVGAGGTHCPVKTHFFSPDRGRRVLTQQIDCVLPRGKARGGTLFYPLGGFGGFGWHVPKIDGVSIGLGGADGRLEGGRWDAFTRLLLERGLIESKPAAPVSHHYYVGGRRKAVRSGNAFIAGDAAGLATVDLGEGIGPAVESGIRTARQIHGDGVYRVEHIPKYTFNRLVGRMVGGFKASA